MVQKSVAHPHDLLVRNFLSDRQLAANFLLNYLEPRLVELLDLDSIECETPVEVDSDLSELVSDLRYSAVFKGTDRRLVVYIFLEHQSTPDRFISFRMIEYICRAFRRYLAGDYDCNGMFPYPVAIVLYHGKTPWRKVLPMGELINTVPGLSNEILQLPVHLVDLTTIPADHIKGSPAVAALLTALQAAGFGELARKFETILVIATRDKNDPRVLAWVEALCKYVLSQCRPDNVGEILLRTLGKIASEEEVVKMTTTWADQWINKGMAEGISKGKAEGKAEGKVEGKAEGLGEAVLLVLEARFKTVPEKVREAVTSCTDSRRLDDLTVLAATCPSVDDFAAAL